MSLDQQIIDKVTEIAQEVCEREGYKLYDVEYLSGQKIVRIYIDKEGGVNLDDCANLSRGVNLLMDIEDPISSAYNLEVSSPGLDRHLSKMWHYEAQKGKRIKVVLKARTETSKKLGKKNLNGTIEQVESIYFILKTEEQDYQLPYEDVHKANVIFEF